MPFFFTKILKYAIENGWVNMAKHTKSRGKMPQQPTSHPYAWSNAWYEKNRQKDLVYSARTLYIGGHCSMLVGNGKNVVDSCLARFSHVAHDLSYGPRVTHVCARWVSRNCPGTHVNVRQPDSLGRIRHRMFWIHYVAGRLRYVSLKRLRTRSVSATV